MAGQGLGIVELVILQEELGYAVAPTPFFSNACAGLLLAAAGTPEQREQYLRPLAAGEKRGTRGAVGRGPGARSSGRLAGAARLVAHGHEDRRRRRRQRRLHLWSAAGGQHPSSSTRRTSRSSPLPGLDPTRKLFTVRLDGVDGQRWSTTRTRLERACLGDQRPRWPPSRPASPSARWRWRSSTPRTASSSSARSAPTRRSRTAARRCCSRPRARARPSYTRRGRSTTSPSRRRSPPRWPRPTRRTPAGA